MGTAGKSARDAGIVGGATALTAGVLQYFGVDSALAALVSPLGGFAVAIGYRIVRRNWPWLLEADPPGGDG